MSTTEGPTVQETSQRDESVGQTLGRYKLLEKLGEGGCGVVYVAEQSEPVRRRVALKVIKLGMDTKAVVARFEAERQALAMMDHPNIAKVLDAGATETGRPYFVMELVRGIRITEYCDQNNLTTKERLELFIPVCQAIQHAHQKGIIHRDIKPSNILVTLHDGVPVPKVIDFGIAKATEGRLTDATVYTQLHQFIGTPAYMSPEQAEMSGLDVDTRSDIYSLGVLLYELLSGGTPFDTKELVQSGVDGMRKIIREREPVRPSTRVTQELVAAARQSAADPDADNGGALPRRRYGEIRELVGQLRGDLDWIVMKCLEKDRTRRYETANGLAMDLKRHLNNETVVARPPSSAYRFQKLVRRNKLAFAAAGAVVAALCLGIIATAWQAIRATHAQGEAVAARLNETKLREQAQAAAIEATQASAKALALARHLRVETYASDMRAADAAMDENNRGSALGLLKRYFPAPGEDDLRGIEWRYLWQACQGDQLKSFVRNGIVNEAALSPDSRFVASSCFDGIIHICDVTSGKVAAQFDGNHFREPCHPLAFSPDGRLLACCCPQGVVLRDTADWRVVRQLPGVCFSVVFSPDGKFLAAASEAGVELWDTVAWHSILFKNQLDPFLGYLVFSSDSRLLAATAPSGAIKLWEVSSQSPNATLSIPGTYPCSISFSPGTRWLAAGCENGLLEIWNLETKQLVLTNKLHASFILGLAFSPDGRTLATGGGDQLIHLWHWQAAPSGSVTLEKLRTFQGHQNEVWSLEFSRDGRFLVSGSKDGTAMLWSPGLGPRPTLTWNLHTNQFFLGFSSDGSLLYSGLPRDGQVEICSWNLADLEPTGCLLLPAGTTFRRLLVQDGAVGYGTTQGTIAQRDLRGGEAGQSIQVSGGSAGPVAMSPDRHRVLVLSEDDSLASLWNLQTGAREAAFLDYDQGSSSAAFSPDSRYLAYATRNYQIKLWSIAEGRDHLTIDAHRWFISSVAFSPDGKLLATGSSDGTAKLWDVATGNLAVPPLTGHLAGPRLAVFSPDGKTLLTSDMNTSIRFWNVATGKEMIALQNGGRCYVSPDGNAIILIPRGPERRWLSGSQIIHLPSLAEIDAREKAEPLSENNSITDPNRRMANAKPGAQQP